MKLSEAKQNEYQVPRVELIERRILLRDGRYLIFFNATVIETGDQFDAVAAALEKEEDHLVRA